MLPFVLLMHIVTAASYWPASVLHQRASSMTAANRCSSATASESLAVTSAKGMVGVAAQPVVWCSLASLKTTGCGLVSTNLQTVEGLAYAAVAACLLGSLSTRLRTGQGLAQAELAAAAEDVVALEAAAAAAAKAGSDSRLAEIRAQASADKAAAVAGWPSTLLSTAEALSYVTAVTGMVVLGFQVVEYGYVPSALPSQGAACWSAL